MKISGFTMGKNTSKLYYPMDAAIKSILPICDEFIVALGDSDEDDHTREVIEKIGDPKIKIVDTVWDIEKYPRGMENAHQTDIAKSHCSGDWCFYVQADEVIHERYLPIIKKRLEEVHENKKVEGLLFKYRNFWGDYDHYLDSHCWYRQEIRIVRNDPEIHSWVSAQSFRRIPGFDGLNYRVKEGTFKLKVAWVDAYVYHYGWVRPPRLMQNKRKSLDTIHKGKEKVAEMFAGSPDDFDYGALGNLRVHKDGHPRVMKDWLEKLDWQDQLNYGKEFNLFNPKHKHEKFKYRFMTFLENTFNGGKPVSGRKNYDLLDI